MALFFILPLGFDFEIRDPSLKFCLAHLEDIFNGSVKMLRELEIKIQIRVLL
jgi:hypothetical protein